MRFTVGKALHHVQRLIAVDVISYADGVLTLRDIEFRHLQALVAVAEERSFGRAATRLGFTQSAISQQIAGLERVVGEPVFDRPGGPRPVELTPLGATLLAHARSILDRVRAAESDLQRMRDGDSGRIVLGTFQSVSVRLLPSIIGPLRSERPGIEIRLVESDEHEALFQSLLDGELDATFAGSAPIGERFDVIPLCVDPYVLITPKGAERSPVPIARLGEVPLVGQYLNSCRAAVDRGLLAAGVSPEYVFESGDNGTVQAMVRVGMGYAVVPGLAVDQTDPDIDICELTPPITPRQIALVVRADRTRSAALDRLVELAQAAGAASGLDGIRGVVASPQAIPF